MAGWRTWEPTAADPCCVHVTPDTDLVPHSLDGGECVCGPSVEVAFRDDGSSGWLVTHHSLDGREARE